MVWYIIPLTAGSISSSGSQTISQLHSPVPTDNRESILFSYVSCRRISNIFADNQFTKQSLKQWRTQQP